MRDLLIDTAESVTIQLFNDDGTPATGGTVDDAEVRISKNYGALSARDGTPAATTEDATTGTFLVALNANDIDTLGTIRLQVTEGDSGVLLGYEDFNVVTADYWNMKYGTTVLPVNVKQINDNASAAEIHQLALTAVMGLATVQTDEDNSTTQIKLDIAVISDDQVVNRHLFGVDGDNIKAKARITAWDETNEIATITALPSVAAGGDRFLLS